MGGDVSVLIPSYNSGDTIERCLRALREQTVAPLETIVVDSSTDGSERLVAEGFPEVRLLRRTERCLPGRARNLAVRAARGRILAFTDADCVVSPTWVEQLLARHAEDRWSVVGGSVENGLAGSAVAWAGLLVEFNEFMPRAPERAVALLPTCNAAYRREVFERHGPFPEDLWPSEDHVFCHRIAAAGERLLFDPAIRVGHLFRPTFSGFLRHQRRLGAASAAARRTIDLPHAWIAESPVRWLVPVLRWARIESRLLAQDPPGFLRFNALLPICLPGLLWWGLGFCRGFGPTGGAAAPAESIR